MTDSVKIIQDISLLYELSLSVGSSLDPGENCYHFLNTLISRKSLNFGAIWLNRTAADGTTFCDLFYIYPHFREAQASVAFSRYILDELSSKPYLSISSQEPHFEELLHEKKVGKGSYAFFKLGDLGFLKLFASNRPDGFPEIEMAQLKQVVDKLKTSLDGCFAHVKLLEETESRLVAQKALEESENKLRRIIDSSLDAVVSADGEGNIIEWNAQAEKMFGYSRKEALGQEFWSLLVPQRHWAINQSKYQEYLKTTDGTVVNNRFEIKCVRKNGTEFPVELSLTAEKQDKNTLFIGFGRDITEQKNARKAIRESEEKYRDVLENMELGLMEVDLEENILRVNNAFCQMLGYSPEELVGKNAAETFLNETSRKYISQQVEEREKTLSGVYEIQMRRKDGALIWGLISAAPLKNARGQIIGSIGIQYDLTERKKLEHELAEAKLVADRARLAERQFLTHMSHEIRTPINAVIGMTHLLDATQPNPTQKEYLNSLRFSADSLLGIVDNILDLSKIEAGEIEFEQKPFNLGYLLKSLLHAFKFKIEEKDLQFKETVDPAIENLVVGDPTRINQILTNLLGNALKFTEKGLISLSLKLLSKSERYYLIEFRVCDTGIGIPADKQDTIFEYFKQADVQINRKFGGTGLGLTIVKQLVEMQGGTIRVESQPGTGSDFIFTLRFGDSGIPVADQELLPEMGQWNSQKLTKGLHFLIVEDNLINQTLICKAIQIWEGTFEVANNGLEALKRTMEQRFDVILMDIHMPELDGCETALAIRKDEKNPNKNVPILALTAAAMSDDKRRAFESGMNGFLTKPISPKALQEHILRSIQEIQPIPAPDPGRDIDLADPAQQIDLSYLLDLSNGDIAFVDNIIDAFLTETPVALQNLDILAKQNSWEQAFNVLHKLKPNLAMLGMKDLHEQVCIIETSIKNEPIDADKTALLVETLISKTQAVLPLLKRQNMTV